RGEPGRGRCPGRGHAASPPSAPARRALRRVAEPGPTAAATATDRVRPPVMLARIAQELFWLGRDLTRAEHTARILDGAFHADVAGAPGERGVALSWEGVLATIGAKSPALGEQEPAAAAEASPAPAPLSRAQVARLLTLDIDNPASVVSCVARARERG